MRSCKCLMVLCVLLFAISLSLPAFAQDGNTDWNSRSEELDEQLRKLFDMPEVPAARALNIDNSDVARPASLRRVSASIGSLLDNNLSSGNSLAVEVAPFLLSKPDQRTVDEYIGGNRMLESIRLSIGVANESTVEGTLNRTALGVRISLLDQRDFRYNQEFVEGIRRIHSDYFPPPGSCPPGQGECSPSRDGLNDELETKYEELASGWRMDAAAVATLATAESTESDGSITDFEAVTAWLAADRGLGSGNSWGLATQLRVRNPDNQQVRSWRLQAGSQVHYKGSWFEGGGGLAVFGDINLPEVESSLVPGGLVQLQGHLIIGELFSIGVGIQTQFNLETGLESNGLVTLRIADNESLARTINLL